MLGAPLRAACRLLSASPLDVELLVQAFRLDAHRRAEMKAAEVGLDARAIRTLFGLYLALTGLELAGLVVLLRRDAGFAALAVGTMHGLLLLGLGLNQISQVLLAEEDFRVIAAWPVSSSSYLVARLSGIFRDAAILTCVICGPAALTLAAVSGTPVITGLTFFLIAFAIGLSSVLVIASLHSGLLVILGAARLRLLDLLLQITAILLPFGRACCQRSPSGFA